MENIKNKKEEGKFSTKKLDAFKPHKKQKQFHKDSAKNRWVFGGNRTGKTECGAVEVLRWANCIHPKSARKRDGVEGWVVSLSQQVQRDVAQDKILKYLDQESIIEVVMQSGNKASPARGVIDYILIRNKFGSESKIGFRSCEQGREKFQGTGLDFVWFDEEPPLDIYEECLLRTLDTGGSIWGTMTPLKGRSWVYDTIFLNASIIETNGESIDNAGKINADNGGISCVFMSWEDNPHLKPTEIKKMERALSPDALESRKHGRFMEGTGLVFSELRDENVIDPIDIHESWFTMLSIDPGFANPTAVLWLAVDGDGNIFVVHDYMVAERTVEQHAREIKAISERLGFPKNDYGGYDAIIDSAALQRNLGSLETVAEQFQRYGIAVNTNVNKSVNEGIMKLKSLFCDCDGRRRLFIFKSCVNLIKELRSYWWADTGKKPLKRDDHCIDALRYFAATDLLALPRSRVREPVSAFKKQEGELRRQMMLENRANQY